MPGQDWLARIVLVLWIVHSLFTMLLLTQLDQIVNHDLYNFGLQFSLNWAVSYWAVLRLAYAVLAIPTLLSAVALALSFWKRETFGKPLVTLESAVSYSLLLSGLVALLSSALSSSSILALIGLGLTFWGALLLYLKPAKYVKLELLTAASWPTLVNAEKMLADKELSDKGIYLPPKYLKNFNSSLVFIPSRPGEKLPQIIEVEEDELYYQNASGMFLTPPGIGLSRLFEKKLSKPFIDMNLEYVQKELPRLLEELEIAHDIEILTEGKKVLVKIRKHILKDLCEETRKLPRVHEAFGCPLSSSIACALAKATGRPIIVEKEEEKPDGETIIQYSMLED